MELWQCSLASVHGLASRRPVHDFLVAFLKQERFCRCKAIAQEEACFRFVGTETNTQKGKKVWQKFTI
jgi:hypothetical protein